MQVQRNNLIETIEPVTFAASVAITAGSWVMSNGAGEFIPLTATNPVKGLCLETIATTDPNYASEKLVNVDIPTQNVDRFLMDATGTATSEMEGLTFDVSNAYTLDVGSAGTQFRITRFISATQVEVQVVKTAVDAT